MKRALLSKRIRGIIRGEMVVPIKEDTTIVAIATPPGNGSVGIIRVSGKDAVGIVQSVFSNDIVQAPSHKAIFGSIQENEEFIDEVLVLVMRAPNSFTGEDVCEVQCHGGSRVTQKILSCLLEKGAVMAQPGQFSYRAFLNGKMDLLKAEAIAEMISAKSEQALRVATTHLQGGLSEKISSIETTWIELLAQIEAWVDFPEDDLEFVSTETMIADLETLKNQVDCLVDSFSQGSVLFEGYRLCLVGSPNAGKSSLMNCLLDQKRAIVTQIPGTTRDVISEELYLGGYLIRLQDTAGIRDTTELVESIGVTKTLEMIDQADLILWVVDSSEALDQKMQEIGRSLPQEKTLIVMNKSDLEKHNHQFTFDQVIVSAETGEGIEHLKTKIVEKIQKATSNAEETVVITSLRHKELLEQASESLEIAIAGMHHKRSPEFICFDLKSGLEAICSILGKRVGERVLDAVFSKFCLGK